MGGKQLEDKIEDLMGDADGTSEGPKQFDSTSNTVLSRSHLAAALESWKSETARGDNLDIHVKDEERCQTKAPTLQTVSVEHLEREVEGVKKDLSQLQVHVGSIDSKLDQIISIMEKADERRKRKRTKRNRLTL